MWLLRRLRVLPHKQGGAVGAAWNLPALGVHVPWLVLLVTYLTINGGGSQVQT